MDKIKVGKFIAECRKKNNLTQMQLAEKLNITDRAISKWENGKAMPDSSIMLDLCKELKISVNELLSGERIEMKNYEENVEMEMPANKAVKLTPIITHIEVQIILFFFSTSFAISSKSCSCFSFLFSILIISPLNNSFTLILSSLHKSSIIDESGIPFPVSHFDIALTVIFNFSASSA